MNALNTALQQTQTPAKETILSLPHQLKAQLPLSGKLAHQIAEQRQTIQNIRWQRSSFNGGNRPMFNS